MQPEKPLFSAQGICVDLPHDGSTHRIIDNISFDLFAGQIIDLNGPSGCGKSTLLRACALMLPSTGGTFALRGRESARIAPAQWRAAVSLVPQKPSLIDGTVRDNLLLPWSLSVRKGRPTPTDSELRRICDDALLEDVALDRDAARLSGGQAARIALLRTLLTRPDVLLMDEVDAALDPESSAAVSRLTAAAAENGAACLRIRHRETDGLACASFTMSCGKLEACTPASAGRTAKGPCTRMSETEGRHE